MQKPATAPRMVEISTLGERLSALRLCDADALTAMRRSLEQHGQLSAPLPKSVSATIPSPNPACAFRYAPGSP